MPRQRFLENNEKLTKANILTKAKALKNRATREVANLPLEVDKYFDKIEVKIELDKLRYLIDLLAIRMSKQRSTNLANDLNYSADDIKSNAMSNYNDLVKKYAPEGNAKQELLTFIDNAKTNNTSIDEVADRVINILPDEYKSLVSRNDISFVPKSILMRRFDEFIVILSVELNNDEIEAIGDKVNEFKSKYEYGLEDNITQVLYSDQTADLISILNNTKMVDGRLLNENEIREYEEALMRANELFGNPTIDLDEMFTQKNDLDSAIDHDQQKNANNILEGMGFDPNVVKSAYSPQNGPYYEIVDNKEVEFNNLKNGIEFELSNETKAGLKEIINKLHEFGYDKEGVTGEQKTKVYGLKRLYEAGLKYKEAISSNNPDDRIKAIAYAKKVYDADRQIKELFSLIDKYMPVSLNNLSYPGNVDSLRTDGMPPEYRLDFIRSSHLANIYSLANLIEEKKWDLDDFLDRPMFYLKQYYNDDYIANVDSAKMHEGLTGDDLLFNIGRNSLTESLDNMIIGGGRIVEGIVDSEKDRELRNKNAAMSKAFTDTVFEPYNIVNGYREYVAKNKHLDSILINPNITFKDLRIPTYNAETLKFEEPDNERFDEIAYIKDRKESLSSIKDRIELSILKYMKNEIELVQRNKGAGVMYLPSEAFVNLCQKAVAKILVIRRDELETEAYQELEAFVKNKNFYVQALVEEINENGKFKDYMIVKNINSNPPTYDNSVYNPARFENGNNYKNILEDYDKYVKDNKALINNQLTGFINDQKAINTKINNELLAYNNLLRKYDAEIKKIYGENYNGEIDNSRTDKLLDLFKQKTEAYKRFLNLRATALDGIEEQVKNGSIPMSYLEDRKLQVENNYFKEIPPLFRTDKPYTMDEYIKLKHPNYYNDLSDAEKEVIYNTYKKTISRIENDFFTRKYLISKDLTDEKVDQIEIQEFEREETEYAELNENVLQAQLIGVPTDIIKDKNISAEDSKFDEIKFLRENNQQIADYKKYIDKKILELANEYSNPKLEQDELANLPDINKVIDVFQKSTLKYLLAVGEIDKANPIYKDLSQLVIDGVGYINKVIAEENKSIDERNSKALELQGQAIKEAQIEEGVITNLSFDDLEEKITFNLKDLGVNDYSINNYSNIINEFDKYYNDKIKTNFYKLSDEIKAEELEANAELLQEYEAIKNSRRNREPHDQNDLIIDGEERDVIQDVNFFEHKNQVKDKLCEYYRNGLISEDYFNERFKRLDKNDFTIPNFFTIDKMPSVNDYVKEKYPTEYNNLTKNEKNQIYNRYKLECIENRRQFILSKFLIEKGLTKFNKPTCPLYESYKNIDNINENKYIYDPLDNLRNKDLYEEENNERIEIEINFDEHEHKPKPSQTASIFDDINDENEIIPSINKNINPFGKWIESLKNILRQNMGEEIYKEEQIDTRFAYDNKKLDFVLWFDTHINSLKEMFGNNIQNVFKDAIDNMPAKHQSAFNEEIQKYPYYSNYFPSAFKNNEIKDPFTSRILESLNEDKEKEEDIIIDITPDDKILTK